MLTPNLILQEEPTMEPLEFNAGILDSIERLYFSMFPNEGTEKHRIMLLIATFSKIRSAALGDQGNGSTTLNKLKWVLKADYSFNPDDIEVAVNALSNTQLFHAVSKYHLNKRKNQTSPTIHLRLIKDKQDTIEQWITKVTTKYPEFKTLLSN